MNSATEAPAISPIAAKLDDCKHDNFHIFADVTKLEGGKIMADIRIVCIQCGTPFCFLGLPMGVNLHGAAVSVDGLEAHLAICPAPNSSPSLL